jgi:molecular chaperone HscC
MFGRPPACELNPDEVVALGAAVQAGLRMKDAALEEVVMTDVSPYSLGVEVAREIGDSLAKGHFDPVIERNSVVPVSRVKRYFPTREGQRLLDLSIYQGEARLVADNILLGRLKVDLPLGTREECGVDVRFTYDVNGLLEVEATVVRTKQVRRLVIEGNPGLLSESEIEARFAKLAALKIHPRDKMENRTVLARGERVYQLLKGVHRERFGMEMALFEQAMEAQDDRTVKPARARLEEVIEAVENELVLGPETIQ